MSTQTKQDALLARPAPIMASWAWLGLMPFFVFAFLFLLYPSSTIIVRTFQDSQTGAFTFKNLVNLVTDPYVLGAYNMSIKISVVTALGGGIFGFMLAYASIRGGLPRFMRSSLMTFSGVASNFAGIPLAFAFIALLSPTGMLTNWLKAVGINVYDYGFTLYKFWGLSLVYMYFQFPLMVLIIAPAIDGLRREWIEASENLGATTFQYWRYVAFPILLPSILGSMILLFGNAFGAFATAVALTGGSSINLATIVIGAQLRGDVLGDAGLGYAVAFGMVIVMSVVMAGYTILQRRAERWLR
ncbi:MAG TPA: ABC transporter permease subunit [Anaerolineales bacterium]|nr:ABC transporter permease subunit [Anaerolineales bacterium]HNO30715.1 ABC transporter permease subunit [Anaerolineales bacterium]